MNRRNLMRLGVGWAATLVCGAAGCRSVPTTGRPQWMLLTDGHERSLAQQAWHTFLANEVTSQNVPLTQLLNQVGRRLADAAARPDYDWDFVLLAGPARHCVCLPGGKLAAYEALLPVCETEAGLAAVLAHQVGHAMARHGGERLSRNPFGAGTRLVADQLARLALADQAVWMLEAYGMGPSGQPAQPFSRVQETEADRIGTRLMAEAGYDPNEAPRFWQRYTDVRSGESVPELVESHPADRRRTTDLLALMRGAGDAYASAENRYGRGQIISSPRQPG